MRIGVLGRTSSEDQAERGTIQNQVEFATKYCDLHQLEIAEWYLDDGISGTIPLEQRPAGARLHEDAKAGRIDLILIYKLDRLGRSARIILNAVYELEQYGVKIRSMTEPFDTGDPSGRFLLTILAGVADLERETILERMWYGANRAARAGKWLGGIVPFGYFMNEDGFLAVNEEPLPGTYMSEADVVRLIYKLLVEQHYSTIKTADYLNALSVPTAYTRDSRMVKHGKRKVKTSGIWRPSRVRAIVISTTYKGLHQYGKRSAKKREIIEREVPAIVSVDIWERAQQVLHENQIEAPRNSRHNYLLRGLIKCGICGLTYQGITYKGPGNKPKNYYVCGGKTAYRGPLLGKCKSKNVPQDWIENLIWNDCVEFIQNPEKALEELAASMKGKKSDAGEIAEEIKSIQHTIDNKEIEKQSILDLYRRTIINGFDVEIQLQKIGQEKQTLENRIKELKRQADNEDDLAYKYDSAEELLRILQQKLNNDPPFEVKREIVKTLVKEIVINTDFTDGSRPRATVTAKYAFFNGVACTDVPAAITVIR
ncbi:MAG: DNA recombinase [Peptococcaceae bacterium BRH_c4a]|nr:MAG: DNA recombinase [Peptococcaceae bacterium BRH_c4a]